MADAIDVERSVYIARPIREIFEFLLDARNDPRWCPRVVSCEQIEGTGPGEGARYECMHQPVRVRKPMALDVQVLSVDRPNRIRLREGDEDGHVRRHLRARGAGRRSARHPA